MRISDQLSNYDDDESPTNDNQSTRHPNINHSHINGGVQSPSVAVPAQIKENILKVDIVWE